MHKSNLSKPTSHKIIYFQNQTCQIIPNNDSENKNKNCPGHNFKSNNSNPKQQKKLKRKPEKHIITKQTKKQKKGKKKSTKYQRNITEKRCKD